MSKPKEQVVGQSDTIDGISRVIRGFYGVEKTLAPLPGDRWQIVNSDGSIVKTAYVYLKFDIYFFALK